MPSSFELFKKQLDDAVGMIEQTHVFDNAPLNLPQTVDELVDTQSLLARCDHVAEKYEATKPVIRIIHHLACSGGTLISKCISAMPNVYLLSEVHPFTDLAIGKGKPKYAPSDIPSLTKYAGIPKQKELAAKLFKKGIDEVYQHVSNIGGTLVLRDHTHADFSTDQPLPEKSTIVELLEETYEVNSVLTIRNPIDAYASLVKNGWVHFEPQIFDEYCQRLFCLIEQFNHEQIFKYEDFVQDPQSTMRAIADKLELPFDETFEDVFGMFKVTGDSGRSSNVISSRERIAQKELLEECAVSEEYRKLLILKPFLNN